MEDAEIIALVKAEINSRINEVFTEGLINGLSERILSLEIDKSSTSFDYERSYRFDKNAPLDAIKYGAYDEDKHIIIEAIDNNYFHIHTKPSDQYRYEKASDRFERDANTQEEKLYEYDVVIDTRIGFISIRDSDGNFIELNSPNNSVTIKSNKTITLDAPEINLRSSNGNLKLDKNGAELYGNTIKIDTTVKGRTQLLDYTEIDKRHSRIHPYERELSELVDIGIFYTTKKEIKVTNK